MKQPAYFDSQAQAAAALNIDIYKLHDAKREGCPAFRSGRVYREELLDWFEEERLRKEAAALNRDESKEHIEVGANAVLWLLESANADLLSHDQMFSCAKAILEAVGNEEMLRCFAVDIIFRWIIENFPELSDAHEAHPETVEWLCEFAGGKYGPPEAADQRDVITGGGKGSNKQIQDPDASDCSDEQIRKL
jgi:hypothetical protein